MFELILVAAGSLSVVAPYWLERRSHKRLDELREGAPEAYFEEQRALEAYPPRGSWKWRLGLVGGALVIFALANLALNHSK